MISEPNIDILTSNIITEEIKADRFASGMFMRLNNEKYPERLTQMLNIACMREQYKEQIIPYFHMKVNNSITEYVNMVNSVLINEKYD